MALHEPVAKVFELQNNNFYQSSVLTFLDAHIECTTGWLQPLLFEIKKDRTNVIAPIIDTISNLDFGYTPAPDNQYGGFDWKLTFGFDSFYPAFCSIYLFLPQLVPCAATRARPTWWRSYTTNAQSDDGGRLVFD